MVRQRVGQMPFNYIELKFPFRSSHAQIRVFTTYILRKRISSPANLEVCDCSHAFIRKLDGTNLASYSVVKIQLMYLSLFPIVYPLVGPQDLRNSQII